jgi:hypothetical protein
MFSTPIFNMKRLLIKMSSIDVWDASVRGDLQEVQEYLNAGCDPNGDS